MRSTRLAVHLASPFVRQRPANVSAAPDVGTHSVSMSSRFTKKSLVNVPGRLVSTPTLDCGVFALRARRPPTSTVISGALRVSRKARSTSRYSAGTSCPSPRKLRNPSASGSSTANDSTSVWSCDASVRPGAKGTCTLWPASFAAFSTAAHPPRTITSASETFFLPLACASLNSFWIPSRVFSTFASSGGLLTAQSF